MAATVLETLPGEFDYFGQIPAHTTLTGDGYEPILPTSPIAAGQARSKIIFKIPGISSCYRDLAKSYMVVKCRVLAANNANLGANDEIAPANLMLSSLFQAWMYLSATSRSMIPVLCILIARFLKTYLHTMPMFIQCEQLPRGGSLIMMQVPWICYLSPQITITYSLIPRM